MNTISLHRLLPLISVFLLSALVASCIEDGIDTSPAHQPAFSTDTLRFGTIFTEEVTTTRKLMVYNRHDKILSISSVGFKNGGTGYFRLNVDGQGGTRFSNVEIRPGDSIFVFIDANLPANSENRPVEVEDCLEFLTNGVTSQVVVTAHGRDAVLEKDTKIETSVRWDADKPRRIYGELIVGENATLSLAPGSHLYFHDGASITVYGTLISEGTAEAPVMLEGDRQGDVITGVSFDLMSRQWEGVKFSTSSADNRMSFTTVRNTWNGVSIAPVEGGTPPELLLLNCTFRNSATHVLNAENAVVRAIGCEFAESGESPVVLDGGVAYFNHCTFSNYYLFSAIRGALVSIEGYESADGNDASGEMLPLKAEFTNCVLYGSSADVSPGVLDNTDVYFRRCLMRSAGTDDDHFIDMLWGKDPLFYTVRESYLFDYRPRSGSPAIGESSPDYDTDLTSLSPVDNYGTPRGVPATLGAYEPRP